MHNELGRRTGKQSEEFNIKFQNIKSKPKVYYYNNRNKKYTGNNWVN